MDRQEADIEPRQFFAALEAAIELLEWQQQDLGGAWHVTTGVEALPDLVVRAAVPRPEFAVLELSSPLVRNPTDDVIKTFLASNGGLMPDGALIANYISDHGEPCLGAFARIPLPSGLWFPPPIRDLIWLGGRGLAVQRSRIQRFAADSHAGVGAELLPAGIVAGPERVLAGTSYD